MLTHFQCDLFNFKNMKGIYLNSLRQEYSILIINIQRVSLYDFWSWDPGTVRIKLTIPRKMGMVDKEGLEFEGWFPLMGPYSLK